mmetsp:Transcript_17488/g.45497  ORF Transcript_17488/g.45497 Transcript_17488/m.45497 type:complete len:152 (+) Transcript_17488:469-924(+)
MNALTDVAELLRFTDRAQRQDRLKEELRELQQGGGVLLGYFPMCGASEALCSVVRIPISDGYVFRTKARAPTLVLFEILRQPSNLSDEESYPLTLDSVGINVNADGVVVGPQGGTLEEVGLMVGNSNEIARKLTTSFDEDDAALIDAIAGQ